MAPLTRISTGDQCGPLYFPLAVAAFTFCTPLPAAGAPERAKHGRVRASALLTTMGTNRLCKTFGRAKGLAQNVLHCKTSGKCKRFGAKRFASKRYDKRLNVKWPFSPETQTFCPKQSVWVRKIECKAWPKSCDPAGGVKSGSMCTDRHSVCLFVYCTSCPSGRYHPARRCTPGSGRTWKRPCMRALRATAKRHAHARSEQPQLG